MKEQTFPVAGMHCAACVHNVERILLRLPGVEKAEASLASAVVRVDYDETRVAPEAFRTALAAVGFRLIVAGDAPEEQAAAAAAADYRRLVRRLWVAWAFALPVALLPLCSPAAAWLRWILPLLTLPVLCYAGRPCYVAAWRLLLQRSASMDTLVALSTSVAFLFSLSGTLFPRLWQAAGLPVPCYYEASAMVVAFVLTGKVLEERARRRMGHAIRSLMRMQPATARMVLPDGTEADRPIAVVEPGDRLRVRPGERIPVDGVVEEGTSAVDESMISGEPVPVACRAGSKVLAGTLNGTGPLVIRACRVGDATRLAGIIRIVREAQAAKAPVQRMADRVTSVFVPVVVACALLAFGAWMAAGGMAVLPHAVLSAVSVLVVACPCALGLATPTALMVGIGRGARMHILIKDAVALETLCRADVLVMDKTGTVTQGRPEVRSVIYTPAWTQRHAGVLLAAERCAGHPLSEALCRFLDEAGVQPVAPDSVEVLPGSGLRFVAAGQTCWAGNASLLRAEGAACTAEDEARVAALLQHGHTVVYCGCGNRLLACFGITDPVRPSSARAVEALQRMGKEMILLTGDNQAAALRVARQVGIERVVAEAAPDEKERVVRKLRDEGRVVAMVGDGINDSPALARADVSIAMGQGTDVAMDVAQVTLMNSDPVLLPAAVSLSVATVRVIRRNLFWAFIYNVVSIPVAAGVLYPLCGLLFNPAVAAAAMAFSSVSVVLSSLRLDRMKLDAGGAASQGAANTSVVRSV